MKTLLKLLCVYLYCAYAFAGSDADKVTRAFRNMRKNKSNELLLTGVNLNNPKAIARFFKPRPALLGERICIKLDQCKIGIVFLERFFGKHYKALHLNGNNSMAPNTVETCLDLLEKKVFSELHINLVNYRMTPEEMRFLNKVLLNNKPLKTLCLTGDCCCTPDDFKMIISSLIGNTQLTTFDVENKNLDDDCLNDLTKLLEDKRRPKIKRLGFYGGNLRKSLVDFVRALPPTLTTLWFGYETADECGIDFFVKQVAKKQLDFFPCGSNFLELSMAYQLEQLMPSEESLEVAPLANAESREVSVVPEMEKSLEPARKKMRVAGVGEATDEGEENPEDKALANIDDAYKNPVMPLEDEERLSFHFHEPQSGFYESESDKRRLYLSPFCQWEDEKEPFPYYLPYDFPLL